MGKKVKVGKTRKDKYYHLAKETGLRSRAAFKLLQLNRKFQFLEKSRVCVDLCAAPGGWLQVAQQNMPMSSVIIGVDLVPIKPTHNVVTFQEDITTEKCKQTLKKELHTWKADVFLHDGAPNVGMNWIYDAFQQAQLTLQALKLATGFLKKGGWFVTKVFRSKDYHALLWVFKQLFKSVHATKPQASRNESAEIFVVCQFYKAPDRLDPKFLDVKYVFKDVGTEPKQALNLMHPEKRKKKAEGYDENDTSFYHKLKATNFLNADNHMELLAESHEIELDTAEIREHKLTTAEITECCKDIKVLGKKDIRSILSWRKQLKKDLDAQCEDAEDNADDKESDKDDSEKEEEELANKIEALQQEHSHETKRKKKKVMKEKRKLRDKMQLQMIHPGDQIEETDDVDLFNLKKIKKKEGLATVEKQEMMDEDSDDPEEMSISNKRYYMAYDRHKELGNEDEEESDSEVEKEADEDDDDIEEEIEMENDDDEREANPLVVNLESKDTRVQRKMDLWFNKDIFTGLEEDADEDLEIDKMAEDYKKRGGIVIEKKAGKSKKKNLRKDPENDHEMNSKRSTQKDILQVPKEAQDSDNSDSDYDVHGSLQRTLLERKRGDKMKSKSTKNNATKDGFQIVSANEPPKKIIKLDPVELALGEEMIKSSKRRRELEEMSYNRYTYGDENLPEWFVKDESRHSRKQLPVTKDQIAANKERLKAIDARPIKKIAEAKARKKRKMTKKLERVRKKAETVSDSVEMSDGEKWKQIKELYKKAGLLKQKKKEVTYVVAKKLGGKKPVRPAGVKGFYKQVDPRMKKDRTGSKGGMKDKGGREKGKGGKGKGRGKPTRR